MANPSPRSHLEPTGLAMTETWVGTLEGPLTSCVHMGCYFVFSILIYTTGELPLRGYEHQRLLRVRGLQADIEPRPQLGLRMV